MNGELMGVVVQRVKHATALVEGNESQSFTIEKGLVVYAPLGPYRSPTVDQLAHKILHIRLFYRTDTKKNFDQSVMAVGGDILVVPYRDPQFPTPQEDGYRDMTTLMKDIYASLRIHSVAPQTRYQLLVRNWGPVTCALS